MIRRSLDMWFDISQTDRKSLGEMCNSSPLGTTILPFIIDFLRIIIHDSN